MDIKTRKGILFALLSAALYALNSPFSKILLAYMPSTLMAGFLYMAIGAWASASDKPLFLKKGNII